jgi:hypothetical protein
MGEGRVGVTPGQTSWPLTCERHRLQSAGEPETKMKHLLLLQRQGLLEIESLLFQRLYSGASTPTQPSPIEGEGGLWQRMKIGV